MVAGSGLHRAGAIRVARREGFSHRSSGLSTAITCPTQRELQCGSLRKCLKWWQSLWDSHGQWSSEVDKKEISIQVQYDKHNYTFLSETESSQPTFPSRMVSHVARFLLTGLSSIPCIDTSYSPSSSCSLLWTKQCMFWGVQAKATGRGTYLELKKERKYKSLPILIKDGHLCNIGLCGLSFIPMGWTSLLSIRSICYIFMFKNKQTNTETKNVISSQQLFQLQLVSFSDEMLTERIFNPLCYSPNKLHC